MTAYTLTAESTSSRARVVGHVDLPVQPATSLATPPLDTDFLADQAVHPWTGELLQRDLERVLAEIRELQSENRWDDILALFHPVETRLPELAENGLANELRLKRITTVQKPSQFQR